MKTKGKRERSANAYLHYLQSFLKGYDVKFRFESVFVFKETMNRLPEKASKRFT